MADSYEQNQGNEEGRAFVPPPPNDVNIRTMDSDIKSMALSGGSFVRPEKVTVPNTQNATQGGGVQGGGGSSGTKSLIWLIVIGAIAILAGVGYFVYPFFLPSQTTPNLPPDQNQTSTPVLPEVPESLILPNFNHESFFRRAGDVVLDMNITYTATKLSDLEPYSKKVQDLLSGVDVVPSLAEINVRKTGGQHLALTQFFQFAGIKVFDQKFLIDNFDLDFTFFVYKNRDGLWPGYVAKPKDGKNWLVLKPEVAKFENSSDLKSLFITEPGDPLGVFKDVLISGQAARSVNYSKPSADLVYGLFHNFLVVSTSEAGLKEAINRM